MIEDNNVCECLRQGIPIEYVAEALNVRKMLESIKRSNFTAEQLCKTLKIVNDRLVTEQLFHSFGED